VDLFIQAVKNVVLVISALFPIVDPIGASPVFLLLTRNYATESRRILSRRIAANSFLLLIVSFAIGSHVLSIVWNGARTLLLSLRWTLSSSPRAGNPSWPNWQVTNFCHQIDSWPALDAACMGLLPVSDGLAAPPDLLTNGITNAQLMKVAIFRRGAGQKDEMRIQGALNSKAICVFRMALSMCWSTSLASASSAPALSPTNIFAPASTPAKSIFDLSMFVFAVVTGIFLVVFTLLVYSIVKFRKRSNDDAREPAQVYGSNQVELAWTVIPCLIVLALFMATARVIATVQAVSPAKNGPEVVVIGHQFWWEYRYPGLNVVAANELHVPVSDAAHPTTTRIKLLSADTDHSFWVPRLAGKTDLIPNHPNEMWIDPQDPGLYLGQCAQYCGTQHAKMLLRVYVDSREDFDHWVHQQAQPAQTNAAVAQGRHIFETTACINCHAVAGTVANGRFGPDLTHLMSRETIGAGIVANTPDNLRQWVRDPSTMKPGVLMPAMNLTEPELDALMAYLETLR